MAVSQGWSHEVVNGFSPSNKNIEAVHGPDQWSKGQNALES